LSGELEEKLRFRLYPLRFSLVARDGLQFAAGTAANHLRGAFGTMLRRIACVPECPGARVCALRTSCSYARLFEPRASSPAGPSGLADWPRPFVLRTAELDNRTLARGDSFCFDLNLFDVRRTPIREIAWALREFAREGFGPRRGRAELTGVSLLNEDGQAVLPVCDRDSMPLEEDFKPLELSLKPPPERVDRIRLGFVTPTELKAGEQLALRPEFGILAGRIRDRLSTLRDLYDDGPLPIDFRAFGERAGRVRMTKCDIEWVENKRRSTRTGQVHSIGGFTGEAEYEGDLAEFVPYLKAAQWTGVGRQTVWGKGQLRVLECVRALRRE
jgi:hypothetical protein